MQVVYWPRPGSTPNRGARFVVGCGPDGGVWYEVFPLPMARTPWLTFEVGSHGW